MTTLISKEMKFDVRFAEAEDCMEGSANYLERDNFETELGSPAEDPFSEVNLICPML